jgi:hypothetical protein
MAAGRRVGSKDRGAWGSREEDDEGKGEEREGCIVGTRRMGRTRRMRRMRRMRRTGKKSPKEGNLREWQRESGVQGASGDGRA